MDFRYSDEQDMMRRLASDFTRQEIIPHAVEWDRLQYFPLSTLKSMREAGLLSIGIPIQWGGAGLDYVSKNLVTEEIARGDAGIAATMVASTMLGSHPVLTAGTPEQQKWWYGLEKEGCLTAVCLHGAGVDPDPGMAEVSCHRQGNEYILNGRCRMVGNGAAAGLYSVFAALESRRGIKGSCAFMVDRHRCGLQVEPLSRPGLRSSAGASIIFNDVHVPVSNLLGREGEGARIAAQTQRLERITGAAIAIGVAQAVFEALVNYSLQRYQCGRPIFELPEIHLLLADMAQLIEAGRLSHLIAAHMLDGGTAEDETIRQTRILCGDIAFKASQDALKVSGGPGENREGPLEKFHRDARILKCGREKPRFNRVLSPAI